MSERTAGLMKTACPELLRVRRDAIACPRINFSFTKSCCCVSDVKQRARSVKEHGWIEITWRAAEPSRSSLCSQWVDSHVLFMCTPEALKEFPASKKHKSRMILWSVEILKRNSRVMSEYKFLCPDRTVICWIIVSYVKCDEIFWLEIRQCRCFRCGS